MTNVSLIAVTVSLSLGASVANAQTCTATAGNLPLGGIHSGHSLNINTCTAANQLEVACNGFGPIGNAPDMVWQMTIGPGPAAGVIVVTPTGTSWDPYLIVMAGACSSASTCIVDIDSSGPGATESGNVPPIGSYWLLITDESGITTCGTANLVLGTLPVTLQSFSVE